MCFSGRCIMYQHIQVKRPLYNAKKCWQTNHWIELSGYKLYMGHIHTLVLTREWIARLGTLTCSPASPDSGSTMPENQGITHFCCQNDVNFYTKFVPSCGIFGIGGEKLNRLCFVIGLKNVTEKMHGVKK